MSRFIIAVVLFAFAPGLFAGLFSSITAVGRAGRLLLPLLAGAAAGFFLARLLLPRLPWLGTLQHELSHALAALFSGHRVTDIRVTSHEGGHIQHVGTNNGAAVDGFITLAPYFVPWLTIPSVLVRPFLPAVWFPWFDVWIGLTIGFHVIQTWTEIRHNWTSSVFVSTSGHLSNTDIGRVGFVYAAIYIAVGSALLWGVLLAIAASDYRGMVNWAGAFWRAESRFLIGAWHAVGRIRCGG